MDPFAGYETLDNPQQFWAELDDILDTPFHAPSTHHPAATPHEALLHAKRIYVASILAKFLHLCAASFNQNLVSEYNQEYCIQRLFSSTTFRDDVDYHSEHDAYNIAMHQLAAEEAIRIMQTSTRIPVLLMTYEIVLQYGEAFPATYKSIQASASTVSFVGLRAFLHRLVHQIWAGSYAAQAGAKIGVSDQPQQVLGWNGASWQAEASSSEVGSPPYISTSGLTSSSASKDIAVQISLREKAVRMLYEVCRVQKLEAAHLKAFDERFIHHLFDLVEETRHHHDEHFNYRLIKLLVAINEQYMVSTLASSAPASASAAAGQINSTPPSSTRPLNLVLSVLQQRLNASKTFGENLIFMLNRASSSDAEDVCMQLLVLKLLYLLFTTKETACYFYTNDLRVLVDIFIRELHDLPDESESLRHTYLRVLHPLLTNTQLCTYPYKRLEIRRLLQGLIAYGHLHDISATTRRLVERCLRAEWCVELQGGLDGSERVARVEPVGGGVTHVKVMEKGVTGEGLPILASKTEGSADERTAETLAKTSEDEVASPVETVSPTTCGSDFAMLDGSQQRSVSLGVPSTLFTRDKRVASLSHPSRAEDAASTFLRPTSAASLSRATAKPSHVHTRNAPTQRAVSAQSAPCTPPRVDSPLLTVPATLETDTDDAMSTSSSWHAHMLDDREMASGKRRDADTRRVGSPLSSESTMQILDVGAKPDGDGSTRRRKPPQPPKAARRGLVGSSSEPMVQPSRSGSPYISDASPAEETPVVGKSGGRRRPPPPPPLPPATPLSASSATTAVVDGTAGTAGAAEEELASAQDFYIAERLRRGLRIR